MRNGMTMLEILVVVIIIGILASIAVPMYTNKIERARGEMTIANIEIIRDAYRTSLVKNTSLSFNVNSLAGANSNLSLNLTDDNFRYNPVNASSVRLFINATRNITSGRFLSYTYNATNANETWAGTWPWRP